jgi:hypothetical protein
VLAQQADEALPVGVTNGRPRRLRGRRHDYVLGRATTAVP